MSASFRQNLFSFDLRSLALFRIGLALLILGDLIHRSFDLRAFYTDFGVLPRWVLMQSSDVSLSLHALGGSMAFQVALFLIAAAFAFMLLVGYRTRLATVLSWVFLISLQDRNFLILQGGDDMMRMLLFWGMFLPLGARCSVDSALANSTDSAKTDDPHHRSMGSIALGIQIILIYWVSAFFKIGQPVWLQDGAGIFYALHVDYLATQTGHWFREAFSPGTLSILSYATLFAEFFVVIPLICTRLRSHWRMLAIGAIVAMHVMFSMVLEVGIFPFVVFTALLAFFPSWFWDKTTGWFQTEDPKGLSIYYDGECSFCKKSVYLIRTFLGLRDASLQPAQSDPRAKALMEEHNSWVVFDAGGKEHLEFNAGRTLFHHSRWPKVLRWFARSSVIVLGLVLVADWAGSTLPDFIACLGLLSGLTLIGSLIILTLFTGKTDSGFLFATGTCLYQWVAGHRELMGRLTAWLQWRTQTAYPKGPGSIFCVFILIYIFFWNLNEMNNRFRFVQRFGTVLHQRQHHQLGDWVSGLDSNHTFMPPSLTWIGRLTHVGQNWSMFDKPPKDDRWLVMPANLADGRNVDIFSKTHGAPDFEKPRLPSSQYPRFRWRKFMENIFSTGREEYLLRYGQFMCREWNRTHPPSQHLLTFEIFFIREYTTPNGPAPPEKILRWTHYCVETPLPANPANAAVPDDPVAPLPPSKNGK